VYEKSEFSEGGSGVLSNILGKRRHDMSETRLLGVSLCDARSRLSPIPGSAPEWLRPDKAGILLSREFKE
jgi:hypothetical protein